MIAAARRGEDLGGDLRSRPERHKLFRQFCPQRPRRAGSIHNHIGVSLASFPILKPKLPVKNRPKTGQSVRGYEAAWGEQDWVLPIVQTRATSDP